MSRRWFYNLHFDGDADNIDSFCLIFLLMKQILILIL